MLRKAAIIAVLCVSLVPCVAQSSDKSAVKDRDFGPAAFDTSDYVMDSLCNDTVGPFYSKTMPCDWNFTEMVGAILQVADDTATATGFVTDTAIFNMQGRWSDDYDSTWHQFWTSGPFDVSDLDNGTEFTIIVPSDTVFIFDEIRLQYYIIAEEDSVRSAAGQGYATYGDSATVDLTHEWRWLQRFKLR